MYRSQVSCSAFTFGLLFCTLQQFHTDIDPLPHQCKVTSIWRGWSSSGVFFLILSSTTDLMIQFQLCYTSNSTWNGIWTLVDHQTSRVSGRSVPLNRGKLTFTARINRPELVDFPGTGLSLSVTDCFWGRRRFTADPDLWPPRGGLNQTFPSWHAVNYLILFLEMLKKSCRLCNMNKLKKKKSWPLKLEV